MRRIIGVLFLIFLCYSGHAQTSSNYFVTLNQPTFEGYQYYSNRIDWTGITNASVVFFNTNLIDNALYHTWLYTSTQSNSVVRIDLSLDTQNWVTLSTVNIAATSVAYTNAIGHWKYYRLALLGTNQVTTLEYKGGR